MSCIAASCIALSGVQPGLFMFVILRCELRPRYSKIAPASVIMHTHDTANKTVRNTGIPSA